MGSIVLFPVDSVSAEPKKRTLEHVLWNYTEQRERSLMEMAVVHRTETCRVMSLAVVVEVGVIVSIEVVVVVMVMVVVVVVVLAGICNSCCILMSHQFNTYGYMAGRCNKNRCSNSNIGADNRCMVTASEHMAMAISVKTHAYAQNRELDGAFVQTGLFREPQISEHTQVCSSRIEPTNMHNSTVLFY